MKGGAERVVRWAYRLALALAGPLLLAGLLVPSPRLLEAGVLVVMVTPVVGLVIVAGAMARARDWAFAGVALIVIAILGSSLYAASHLPAPVKTGGPAAAAGRP